MERRWAVLGALKAVKEDGQAFGPMEKVNPDPRYAGLAEVKAQQADVKDEKKKSSSSSSMMEASAGAQKTASSTRRLNASGEFEETAADHATQDVAAAKSENAADPAKKIGS